jgi:hypothetical protein
MWEGNAHKILAETRKRCKQLWKPPNHIEAQTSNMDSIKSKRNMHYTFSSCLTANTVSQLKIGHCCLGEPFLIFFFKKVFIALTVHTNKQRYVQSFLTPIENCGLRSCHELVIRTIMITAVGAVKLFTMRIIRNMQTVSSSFNSPQQSYHTENTRLDSPRQLWCSV